MAQQQQRPVDSGVWPAAGDGSSSYVGISPSGLASGVSAAAAAAPTAAARWTFAAAALGSVSSSSSSSSDEEGCSARSPHPVDVGPRGSPNGLAAEEIVAAARRAVLADSDDSADEEWLQ